MQKIAVITDSCAGLSAQIAAENDIFVLPLSICAGGQEYRADVDIFPADIYRILEHEIPKTSLPSIDSAITLFQHLVSEGYTHAIAVMLSGGLSGTANMMRIAGEQVPGLELTVWDTLSGSVGCGISVLEVAADVKIGKSYEEINARLPFLLAHTQVFFSVDTLEYLQKGGRIGRVAAIAGTALQIKPILSFLPDGQLGSVAKVRGKKMVPDALCEQVGKLFVPCHRYNLVVADGGDPEGGAQLKEKLTALFPDYERLLYGTIDSTLSCYIGPGILGAGIQILD